jgi:hypothetical protein
MGLLGWVGDETHLELRSEFVETAAWTAFPTVVFCSVDRNTAPVSL